MAKQDLEKGSRLQDVAVSIVQAGDLQELQNFISEKSLFSKELEVLTSRR